MKVITICGSMKFKDEMIEIAEQMTLDGNVVLLPIFSDSNSITEEELLMLGKMHKEKIAMSTSVFIVNIDGYIGNSTKSEIEYAESLNKEIIYYSELI
ncbi:MAG: hypothetical protein GXZ08_04645 [Tissierellia bacterium]|nr:hypothetical protein [Tissierellia bacterium]